MTAAYRPKYSTELIAQALKDANGLVSLAARKLGCSDVTIYKRLKRSPLLQEVLETKRAELVDLAEAKLRTAILSGEPWAIAMTLKTLGKQRGYTERHELSGPDGEAMRVVVTWDDKNDNADD